MQTSLLLGIPYTFFHCIEAGGPGEVTLDSSNARLHGDKTGDKTGLVTTNCRNLYYMKKWRGRQKVLIAHIHVHRQWCLCTCAIHISIRLPTQMDRIEVIKDGMFRNQEWNIQWIMRTYLKNGENTSASNRKPKITVKRVRIKTVWGWFRMCGTFTTRSHRDPKWFGLPQHAAALEWTQLFRSIDRQVRRQCRGRKWPRRRPAPCVVYLWLEWFVHQPSCKYSQLGRGGLQYQLLRLKVGTVLSASVWGLGLVPVAWQERQRESNPFKTHIYKPNQTLSKDIRRYANANGHSSSRGGLLHAKSPQIEYKQGKQDVLST